MQEGGYVKNRPNEIIPAAVSAKVAKQAGEARSGRWRWVERSALVMASDSLAPIPAACKLQISEFCKKLHLKIPPGPPFSGKRAWRDSEVGKLNKTHLPLRSLAKPWARLPEKGGLRGILMGCWTTQFSNRTTLSQHSASKIDPSSMDIAASSP